MQPRLGPTTSGGPSDAPLVVVSRWLSCRRQRAARSNLGLEEVKPSLMIGRELDRQRNESWPQPRPPTADWPKSAEPKLFSPLPLLFLFSFLFATDPAGSSCKSRRISKHDCDPASPASSSSLGPAPNDPRWPRQTTLPKQRPPSSSSTSSISPSSSSSSHLRRPAHRGARSKLEPLVRLFIFVLLVYELHLASLEWWSGRDQRLGSPLPHAQEEQQQNRLTLALRNRTKGNEKEATDCVSREGESVGLVHQRQPSLNKLINWPWPRPPTPPLVQRYNWRRPPPAVLRSMVVSLFAFPLCRANELVGQLSGDKDKESAKLPFAIESDSPSAFPSSLPSVGGEGGGGVEETRGTPTMKTTLAVEANGTNTNTTSTSTYEGTGLAQAEIPINLVAEGRPTAVAGVAETEAESSSYSPSGPSGPRSAKHGQQQQHGQPPAAGVGGGGQNNSNNNNNNETANRSPQPGKVVVFATAAATTNTGGEDPVSSSPSPSSLPSSSSSAASSLADAESTNLLQLQTTAPKTGSHAQAFDPNSAIAKTETDTGTATETVDARNGPSKTRQGRPTKEAANLTMTMERLGLAKKMRQRQQQKQQQQQQQHLTMTSKPTTTRMGKDSSLARSLVALEEKSAVAMSSVICNSRCQCVQLEFVTDDDGDDGELASGETDEGPPDRSSSKGSSRANCKSQPGATTITRPTNATTTTITTDPAPVPLFSSAASQSNVNETDDDAIALAQNQTQCDASGGSDESSGNRIALIEFSQDYSFDDELEAPSDFEGASGWPEDELAEGGAKSEQTTTATTIPTRTTTTPQPGNGPQNQQPAPASRTSGQAGDQQQQQQQQAATSSATASSSLSSSLSSWLGTDRRPSAAVGPSGPGVAAKATTTTATTIKQTGDDQSKDVNVSSATGPASGGRRASRLMLSIKDNKTGTGATNGASTSGSSSSSQTTSSQGSSLASIDGDEESQVRVTPSSSSTATRTTTTAPLGAERHSTDKDSGLSTQLSPAAGVGQPPKRNSQQQPTQPEPASAENFYPFLGDHHHLHQRHHLADHQMGPSVAGLPSASYMLESQVDLAARRQRKGNAIAAAAAAAEHHHHHQDGRSLIDSRPDELGGRRPIKRIVPLRSRSLIVKGAGHTTQREGAPERGGGAEVEDMVRLLEDIKGNQIQSVSLRSSKLKFELWTEIYALLAIDMRQNLYHLDLAHNDLVKLGVTFTGYIEHHLAYQLLVHNNQSWPFPNQHQQQTTPHQQTPSLSANTTQQQQQIGNNNYLNLIQLQQTQQSLSSPQSTSTSSTTTTTATSASTISLGLGAAPSGLGAQGASNARRAQLRHPNLGDGRLFNAVRSRLPVDISSLIIHLNKGHTSYTTTTTTGNSHINQTTTTPSQTNTNTINTNAHSSLANHPMLLRSRLQQSPTVLHQPSRIRALDLSHNKLRWLINDQFRILKHVESIRLDHNQIRFIHQLAFNGLESLKYLNLNYNKIQTIYMEQFQTNYNLMALFMRSNYLSFLRAGSFASLNQLKRLDLSKNRFTFLSNNAFVGLDSLKLLNLSSNQFVHVPSTSFHSLAVKLKTLDLSRNLLAQLMPGTFFHLKLERLLLDHNDQLVAIDRGAFWDLPYLKYLSLSSSQVLININSQAFVGVPNLETINYEDCQLLDADTKQMLDNITTSTTLRQLKQQQQQLGTPNGAAAIAADNDSDKDDRFAPIGSNLPSGVIGPMKLTAISAVAKQLGRTGLMVSGGGGGVGAGNELDIGGAGPSKTRWLMKYVYSAACVMFVVIALKLVFKYTSTRHYLNMRRRRRRVYQSSSSSSSASSGSSPASDQHGSSVGDSLGSEDNGSEASLEFASVSESLDNKQNDSPVSLDGGVGDSFMMRELQPHNVIVGPSVSCDTSQHQVDISIVPESSVPSSSPEDNSSVIAVDNGCQNDSSELQQGGEFQLEHHEPFMGCFDCCNQQCGNETDPTNPSSSSSLHVPDDDGTLRGHDLAFEMINGQQLLDQSQICDNLASTNLESAQLELGEHRRESTILDDHHLTHQMTASHANGPGQSLQSVVPDESDNGNCEQNQQQQHLATITSTSEHLEQMHQSPDDNNNNNNNNNGPPPPGPLYGSFRTHTGQTSQQQQWTDQTDCRLFHCACLRCGGPPELVGVNGYI